MKRNLKTILAILALGVSASAFAGNGLGPAGSVGTGTGPYSWRPASVEQTSVANGFYSVYARRHAQPAYASDSYAAPAPQQQAQQ